MTEIVSFDNIQDAAKRIEGVVHRSPVLTSRTLNDLAGAEILLKCENFQRIGAFKMRGAYNTISRLSPEQLQHGVIAYSSGNHAQAVALSARLLDSRALIVMPEDAPEAKLAATRRYGAEIVTFDRYTADRSAIGEKLAQERDLTLVPPYDHPHVIAGQGTTALELLEDAGCIEVLVAPISGGGLIAGCATAAKALHPGIRMVGVEPENGDDTKQSLQTGSRVAVPVPRTIADGLTVHTPGELTFEINRQLLDDIVLVSDDEIRAAMRLLFERLKIVVEPSGATPVAALLSGRISGLHGRVGVVISGGNIGADRFAELLRD